MFNSASRSDASPDSASRALHRPKPFRAFAVSVYQGGLASWLLMVLIIAVYQALMGLGSTMSFLIPFSVIVWVIYCTMIILVFFFIPFLAVRLGREFPAHSRLVITAVSTLSSLAICTGTLFLFDILAVGEVPFLNLSILFCSVVGGAVAGNAFWKRVFPPMADISDVFQ